MIRLEEKNQGFLCGFQVEQLHKIFKLCGSPPDDYWRKLRPSTSFRPQNYKPSFEDAFKVFPSSSFGLLTKLLALDPESRGTAASSLQNEVIIYTHIYVCSLPMMRISTSF